MLSSTLIAPAGAARGGRTVGGDEQIDMNEAESPSAVPKPSRRWFRFTPDRFVIGLLVVEGLLDLHGGWPDIVTRIEAAGQP